MSIRFNTALTLAILLVVVTRVSVQAAPPPLPSSFFGTVILDGASVPPGTLVSAWINGVKYAETVTTIVGSDSVYVIDVPGDIVDTPGFEGGIAGDTIVFKVADQEAFQMAIWVTGNVTELNLTATSPPDLVVTKDDGQTVVLPGQTMTYTLTISNSGPPLASGITVTDTLPLYTTFIATSHGGNETGGIVTWPTFDLAAGMSTSRTVAIQVQDPLPAGVFMLTNIASVIDDGAYGSDPNPENNVASDVDTVNAVPDLVIGKDDGLTQVMPGQSLTYILTISNTGNQGATGVTVTDLLPDHTIFVAASHSGNEAGGVVTWPAFDLAAGLGTTRTVTIRVDDPVPETVSTLTNTGTVVDDGTNGPDPTPDNNVALDVDTVIKTEPPDTCQILAVHDASTSNSQLFAIDFTTLEETITSFGPEHRGADIEGLGLDPLTGFVYGVSGLDGRSDSILYQIDASGELVQVGALRDSGGTGFQEVASLAFRPDGTLWGFARKGSDSWRGLLKIDPASGLAELVVQSNVDAEGLAWDPTGSTLWLSKGRQLYAFTPGGDIQLVHTLSDLPGDIEGLEFRPDGLLLAGLHHGGVINIYTIDVSSGAIITTDGLVTHQFDDVESLIWPATCSVTILKVDDVNPGNATSLTYTDIQGNAVKVSLPAGAIAEPTTLSYTELDVAKIEPANPDFANQVFRLNAYRHGTRLETLSFDEPATIKIEYGQTELGNLDENNLVLRRWDRDEQQWRDAACGAIERRPAENWIAVPICHLTEFGLFAGESQSHTEALFLPLITKGE